MASFFYTRSRRPFSYQDEEVRDADTRRPIFVGQADAFTIRRMLGWAAEVLITSEDRSRTP